MMAHPLALQLRNLQSLVGIGVDKTTTVVFPAPADEHHPGLGAFLAREAAGTTPAQAPTTTTPATSPPPAGQAPAPDAAFNTDDHGAAGARSR
jgi:hypothetical protein